MVCNNWSGCAKRTTTPFVFEMKTDKKISKEGLHEKRT